MSASTPSVPLAPFFYYYGAKNRVGRLYPRPEHDTIIEPFAGSASYSLHYPQRRVLLSDIDPVIAGVWEYLIRSTPDEIRRLPLEVPTTVDDLDIPQEARWLLGFWMNKGSATPKKSPSVWMRDGSRPNTFWGTSTRERIATQVDAISHWRIRCCDYLGVEDFTATWFVDPPYDNQPGTRYRFHDIDYAHLSSWVRERSGQVIVCENEGAEWLPFQPLAAVKSSRRRTSREVVWTNHDTDQQLALA